MYVCFYVHCSDSMGECLLCKGWMMDAVEEMVCVLQRGNSGDGCDLVSTLCKYDLRKGDLIVLSWARVRRVKRGSVSSELIMRGGGARSILLLHSVARCLDVCMYMAHVCFCDCVGVCGNVCYVSAIVKHSLFFLAFEC